MSQLIHQAKMPEGKYIEHPSLKIVFHDKSVVRVLDLLLLLVLSTQFKGIGIVNKEIGNCRRPYAMVHLQLIKEKCLAG